MKNKFDVIVIGGGILGVFHAYHAALKGLSVAVLEKDKRPLGATVRNFGQVVPSGMNEKWQRYGRESLAIYKGIQAKFDISLRQNGTVYLASNAEEEQLINELALINKNNDYSSLLLSKKECLTKYPGLRKKYAKAGLFFPEEVTVEPNTLIDKLQQYMKDEFDIQFLSNDAVVNCDKINGEIHVSMAKGKLLKAENVFICNGSEFKILFPEVFVQSDLQVVKLQMMQTKPQENYVLNGSILTGGTIRRYESFQECPSYLEIKENEDKNSLAKKWGVHILFKQAIDGSVIIGDSHEYAAVNDIDDLGFSGNMLIDNFMLAEAKKIIKLPTYKIAARWNGMYSQCKNNDVFKKTIAENIHVITGIGGKGMTGSAGFSKENIEQIYN